MTHDEILNAARERIAEIDKQKAALDVERAKLQAMLGPSPLPVAPFIAPWTPPLEFVAVPLPYVTRTTPTTTGRGVQFSTDPIIVGGTQRLYVT